MIQYQEIKCEECDKVIGYMWHDWCDDWIHLCLECGKKKEQIEK